MKIKSSSRIFSFSLSTLLALSLLTVTSYSKAHAVSSGPELLITEVMPMSQTGDDAYEYIELYNNSDNEIDLKDYKLPYQNVDITNSKIIPSKSAMVICTRSNTSLTNFNTFYGTNLTEDRYMTLPLANEVLSNTISQSILLAKDDGTVVTRANYNNRNFEVKKSVTYQYPQTGFDMRLLGNKQNPTPGAVAADQVPYTGISVTGVTLDKSLINMDINQTTTIYATVSPITASNKAITWTSSDTSIAAVSSSGVITAKSQGVAIITAKTVDGGYTSSCVVQVQRIPVTGVVLDKSNITLDVGKANLLTATINPDNATNKSLIWTSSNRNIATVDSNGLVIGKSQGTALITAKTADGNYTASCTAVVNPINVNIAVSSISLNKTNITMEPGKAIVLEAKVKPDNATNKQVTWSSSNTNIVTVDENGVIFSNEQGTAVITVKTVDGGYTATCQVTVSSKIDNTNSVTSIRINRLVVTMKEGQSKKLTAIIFPDNTAHKSVKWESDNPEVATISSDGKVIGLNSGIATITVTTEDGKYSAKCYIYVEEHKGKAKGHLKHWKDK